MTEGKQKEWYSTEEAVKFTDLGTDQTFRRYARKYGIQNHRKPGKGNTRFYRKEDLEKLKHLLIQDSDA